MDQVEYPAAGSAGLAMAVGEQREKVNRLREDLARAETDLREADARDKADLSGIDHRQQTTIDTLSRTVSTLTERVAALESKEIVKSAAPPPPLPKRNDRESTGDYRTRVAAWARQNGKPEPPKVGGFDSGSGYAEKVASFYGSK